MIELLDGRSKLYQWDTDRYVVVDTACTQVHFRVSLAQPAIPAEVEERDGKYVAPIPPELLQDTKDVVVYAFSGSPDCGYTREEKVFEVVPKPKPADYVFTPTEQITMQELEAIIKSVREDADSGKFNGDPGPQGPSGPKGDPGTSVSHQWDGTKLIITSASGTSSADLGIDIPLHRGSGEHSIVGEVGCDASGDYSLSLGHDTKAISHSALSFQEIEFISYKDNILTLKSEDNFFDNNSIYAFRIENFSKKLYMDIVRVIDSVKDGDNWRFTIEEPVSELSLEIPSQTLVYAIVNDNKVNTNHQYAGGYNSYAIGEVSHAEGIHTLSAHEYTHSEGWGTVAYGRASHTEGYNTKTIENYAHAEGSATIAGYCSHAEGSGTKALGYYSHSEGYNTEALGDYSHAEGATCKAIGNYSHAENCNTKAVGDNSHSEGISTQALGYASHVEGSATTSKGNCSHVEGLSSTVAPEDGINCSASEAINKFLATRNYSLAYGEASHVEGKDNLATGIGSHTEGSKNVSAGDFAHSEGYATKSTGAYAHTEGYMTEATRNSSHAEGYSTKAIGDFCHTEGVETEASGSGCHAEGGSTKAYSYYSHAEGYKSISVGNYSHAEGYQTTAAGQGSHTEGLGTQANGDYQHVQGKWNIVDKENKYAHIVGNGTSNTNRVNIHTLDWSGNAWYAGTVTVGRATNDTDNDLVLVTKGYMKSHVENYIDKQAGYYTPSVDSNGDLKWTPSKSTLPTVDSVVNIKGPKGDKGDKGDTGEKGNPGDDGISPVVTFTPIDNGYALTIAARGGSNTVEILNGKDGEQGPQGEEGSEGNPGPPGKDGVSATHRWDGTTLIVTSASGTTSANLKGDKGEQGPKGDSYILTDSDKADIIRAVSAEITAELNAALLEIKAIQEDLMTPDGDEVKY